MRLVAVSVEGGRGQQSVVTGPQSSVCDQTAPGQHDTVMTRANTIRGTALSLLLALTALQTGQSAVRLLLTSISTYLGVMSPGRFLRNSQSNLKFT